LVVYRLLDVSLGGARFEGVAPAAIGTNVVVELGRLSVPATIIRCGGGTFGVAFERGESTRMELIGFIYSGRYSAAVPKIEPARVMAAVLGRVMR
jgi:cellulose synthase (UDP-forming)